MPEVDTEERWRRQFEIFHRALEKEPAWLRSVNREYWRRFGWTLGKLFATRSC